MTQGLGDGRHTPTDPQNHPVVKEGESQIQARREGKPDRRRHRDM